MMKYIPLLSILFFISCSNQSPILKSSLIESSRNFYIAHGTGDSEKEAIAEGLERIASTLSSEVSSVFKLRKKSSSSDYDKTTQHDIKVEVEKIKFSYNLLSSYIRQNRCFVTIKVDRKKSAMLYSSKLQRTINKMKSELKTLSSLKKYLFLKTYPFHKLYYKLDIISMIDSDNIYMDRVKQEIKRLEEERYKYQKELTFHVDSRNRYLRDVAIGILSDEHFNISLDAKIKLTINLTPIEIEEIYGEYYAKSSVVVKIVKNREVITRVITLLAEPSSTQDGSKDNIMRAFQKEFPQFIKKEF